MGLRRRVVSRQKDGSSTSRLRCRSCRRPPARSRKGTPLFASRRISPNFHENNRQGAARPIRVRPAVRGHGQERPHRNWAPCPSTDHEQESFGIGLSKSCHLFLDVLPASGINSGRASSIWNTALEERHGLHPRPRT